MSVSHEIMSFKVLLSSHITETSSTKIGKSRNIQFSEDFHFVNLDPVITFQTKQLNVYIWMKETKLYVARIFNLCTQSFSDVTGFTTNPVLQTKWSPVRHRKYLAWTQRSNMPCRENEWETEHPMFSIPWTM